MVRRWMSGRGIGLRLVVTLLALPFAAPLAYLVVRTWDEGEALDILGDETLLAPLGRSLLLASTVALSASAVGTLAAWLVMRTDLPGRSVLRLLLPLPLVLPSFIGAFALVAAFASGGLVDRMLEPIGVSAVLAVDGYAGAFTVLTLLTYPYVYLPVAARLRQLPSAMEESARLLGRGPLATFASVVLPQARAAIGAGGLLVFLYVLSDFGAVQLLRYDTLTRAIYANRLIDPAVAATLSLALGLLAIVVVVGQRALSPRAGRDARRQGPPPDRGPRAVEGGGAGLRRRPAHAGAGGAHRRADVLGRAGRGRGHRTGRPPSSRTRSAWSSPRSTPPSPAAPRPSWPWPWCSRSPTCRCATVAASAARPTPSSRAASPLPGIVIALALAFWTLTAPARSARSTRRSRCWWAPTPSTSGPWRSGRPGSR